MIRDLETLVLSVRDNGQRSYVRESVSCYNAGANRAAVVIAVAAGMDGLRQKLQQLAATGGAIPALRTADQQIQQAFRNQEPFERQLIQTLEATANMLTPAEATKLTLLLQTRHLCAHPSGHAGSAEEARDAISTIIDLVLSRPTALGMAGVTDLVSRLAVANFFPSPDWNRIVEVVNGELARLNPSLMNALGQRLVTALTDEAVRIAAGGILRRETDLYRNTRRFLAGMLVRQGDSRSAVWSYLDTMLAEPNAYKDAAFLLAYDPDGLTSAEPLTRMRAVGAARWSIAQPEGRRALRAWIDGNVLSDLERQDVIATATTAYVQSHTLDEAEISALAEIGLPDLVKEGLGQLVERAGSNSFDTSNRAVRAIQALTAEQAALLDAQQQVAYIINVVHAAGWNAFAARQVLDTGLGSRASFLDGLISVAQHEPDALAVLTWSGFLVPRAARIF